MTNDICFTGNAAKCDECVSSLNEVEGFAERNGEAVSFTEQDGNVKQGCELNENENVTELNGVAQSDEISEQSEKKPTRIDILTLYPEMFSALSAGIMQRAREKGLVEVNITNIRDYTTDKHGKCDDYAFGGGAGMVMTPQPIADAIRAVDEHHEALRIYMSPRGETLTQDMVCRLAKEKRLLFLCGHYEGVDQRAIDLFIDKEISIGDYVLMGGELPAMVTVEALARYIPEVLHSEDSTKEESFVDSLLEYPQYTRPAVFEGVSVPEVLLSGHHGNVEKWRFAQRVEITRERRPDLFERADIPEEKPKKPRRRKHKKTEAFENADKTEASSSLNETACSCDESVSSLNQAESVGFVEEVKADGSASEAKQEMKENGMNILLISSVTGVLTVGIYKNGEIFSADSEALQRDHSAMINGAVQRVLEASGLSFSDIDAYACVVGPGSFTGIRVGIATVKGYAMAHSAPFIAVNSLELPAYNETDVDVEMDAGKGLVYSCSFRNGIPSQTVMTEPSGSAVAFDLKRSYIRELGFIAARKYANGEFVTRPSPLYVQLCQAENEFNARNKLPVVRRITVGDVGEVVEINKVCLPDEAWSYEMFVKELEEPTADIYGCFCGGRLAGYAQIRFDGEQIYLGNIAVLPEYRRNGYAKELLQRIFEDYKRKEVTSCFLHVRKGNSSAIAFYEALGFGIINEIKDYYPHKEAALAMLKGLN